mmetsp:Transcript_5/g.30  ORF Transcript_5/g.30 Transcript_5/m.30 type:complete len:110 (+) Transcript_5:242-571(+)|eukprot:scaffold166041_cov36-Tisochrysis_lutea.AAC.3
MIVVTWDIPDVPADISGTVLLFLYALQCASPMAFATLIRKQERAKGMVSCVLPITELLPGRQESSGAPHAGLAHERPPLNTMHPPIPAWSASTKGVRTCYTVLDKFADR